MKKLFVFLIVGALAVSLTACGSGQDSSESSSQASVTVSSSRAEEPVSAASESTAAPEEVSEVSSEPEQGAEEAPTENTNVLVAYFTYSENMGDTSGMDVDAITSASLTPSTDMTQGNLQVMAQTIQEKKGADVFQILVEEPYDPEYDVMHDRAISEQSNGERPALKAAVEDISQYDVVFLGTPVWGGALPAPVLSFLEENDLSGKTVIPFGIHLGSRFGRIPGQLEEQLPDAEILEGLTIYADTANADVRAQVEEWIDTLAGV